MCIFLFGGNDANNVLAPNETTGGNSTDPRYSYQNYAKVRQNLALAQNTLSPIHDSATGVAFGLHPSLAPLANLYNTGRLTLLTNVGTLVQPVPRDYSEFKPPDLSKVTIPEPVLSFRSDLRMAERRSHRGGRIQAGPAVWSTAFMRRVAASARRP